MNGGKRQPEYDQREEIVHYPTPISDNLGHVRSSMRLVITEKEDVKRMTE